MALVDDVIIKVKAGNGGDGGRAFHTNYGSTKVHRDGGNGGRGGDVFFSATPNISDLSEFRFKKVITAENGERGMRKTQNGKKGNTTTILVPLGTTLIDVNTQESVEMVEEGKEVLAAQGGRGGIGNFDPEKQLSKLNITGTAGQVGEERELHLILNLIADIGLAGLPNAGKSSLLKILTNATPKIGAYPFTTLEPNLGIMKEGRKSIIIADIPGLIEGASTGKGLGIQFLKHIQKTKILLHCIDASLPNAYEVYETVRNEFKEFDPSLLEKKELILLTKTDLITDDELKKQKANFKKTKNQILGVSIFKPGSIEALKTSLLNTV